MVQQRSWLLDAAVKAKGKMKLGDLIKAAIDRDAHETPSKDMEGANRAGTTFHVAREPK